MLHGISSPGARQSTFPSQRGNRSIASWRGGTCPIEQVSAARSGEFIFNAIWQGSPGPQSLDIFDPETGRRLFGQLQLPFDAKNTCITRTGQIFLFAGPPRGELDGLGAIVNRFANAITPFRHVFGFTKASAPTIDPRYVLVTDQNGDRLHKVDIAPTNPIFIDGVQRFQTQDPGWPPGGALTGSNPRGVAQSSMPPYKIWVACKGANVAGSVGARIQAFNWRNGARSFSHQVPLGARGVAIDPSRSPAEGDEIWVACLGQQTAGGNPVSGEGEGDPGGDSNIVVRIQDSSQIPGEPGLPRLSFIHLGATPLRGPISIAASLLGHKYVACTRSHEVWKIPKNVDDLLRSAPASLLRGPSQVQVPQFILDRNSVPGWPVCFGAGGPISVSIDGNGRIVVLFKSANRLVILNDDGSTYIDRTTVDPVESPDMEPGQQAPTPIETGPRGVLAPENIGDFTGYYTAAALYPCDISNGIGPFTNIEKLQMAPTPLNPFVTLSQLLSGPLFPANPVQLPG